MVDRLVQRFHAAVIYCPLGIGRGMPVDTPEREPWNPDHDRRSDCGP